METGVKALPNDVYILLGYTGYSCVKGTLTKAQIEKLDLMLKSTTQIKTDYMYRSFKEFMDVYFSPYCELVTYHEIKGLLISILENPNIVKNQVRLHEMLHLLGLLELRSENPMKAKEAFWQSLQFNMHPSVALQQIAVLGSHDQYDLAYDYLLISKELFYGKQSIEENKQSVGWDDFIYIESVILEELAGNTKGEIH